MIFTKDPDAILDYTVDWSSWLGGTDTIASSTWTVPTGLTKTTDTMTGTSATVWLSGGTLNETYQVTNEIVTVGGRTEDRTIIIKMRQH